jgi:lipopolysaccharide transport system ATP-binding protein
MSDDVVIRATGLGKKYMIGHQSGERYTALRDVMAQATKNLARTAGDMFRGKPIIAGDELEEFWALKDVSFEIKRGDVVGIIGRNGAGKSTLLKVLSRITEPSEGRVEIKGRVASLLEVGTGFHPELTGRENIYLNGAILGMTRSEIKQKFDEIVDFAEVEKFLDTPVKRYSSGMYVRLAFAVAAHLEPEILIVDEVLAVGDAEFQKKCLGKMKDVAGHGRTVLFVSHNIPSIMTLCSRGFLLQGGLITDDGDATTICRTYLTDKQHVRSSASFNLQAPEAGDSVFRVLQARVVNALGNAQNTFSVDEPVVIEVACRLNENAPDVRINFHLSDDNEVCVFASIDGTQPRPSSGIYTAIMTIPPNFLNAQKYFISIYASSFSPNCVHAQIENALSFDLIDNPDAVTRQGYRGPFPGVVRPIMEWQNRTGPDAC